MAADIYAGYFVFNGQAVDTGGRSPFVVEAPSTRWAEALADFGWLRHLRAADSALARVNARALVGDWIVQAARQRRTPAWTPEVVARRTLAWLSQSPIILDGADGFFYRRFMRSLGRQTAFLRRALAAGLAGEARLFAAIALTEMALCAEGYAGLRRHATRILVEEIGAQVLPDGGHVSRDAGILIELLLLLLPLRQAFVAAGTPAPAPLLNAVDRMMPMLRAFRHGDGAMALFNGMGSSRPEVLATILAYDDLRGRPLLNAPHSGYQRLEAGGSLLILDSGAPPPIAFSRRAHAGTLSFEFSSAAQRIIVNCGKPAAGSSALAEASRLSAAHSTLVAADRSSSRFVPLSGLGQALGGLIYAGPRDVRVARTDDTDPLVIEASHDGYRSAFGLIHRRRLALSAAGDRLEGSDDLTEAAGGRAGHRDGAFALRFHLHPSLRASPIRDGTSAAIACPNGDVWLFEADGLPVRIEESIYFGGADGARRTDQLVVEGHSRDRPSIAWTLWRDESRR